MGLSMLLSTAAANPNDGTLLEKVEPFLDENGRINRLVVARSHREDQFGKFSCDVYNLDGILLEACYKSMPPIYLSRDGSTLQFTEPNASWYRHGGTLVSGGEWYIDMPPDGINGNEEKASAIPLPRIIGSSQRRA